MKTRRILQLVLAFVIVTIALFAINRIQQQMLAIRDANKTTIDESLQNAPPVVAFTTIALGGFRGLLADILFLRSEAMKEQERYFEMVQLGDWIVKLQPSFTGAHAFLAWNMAYNVSVTFSDHEDRWRWVQRGVELLRDVAIIYNPDDPKLYRELGWIYQHKMGNILDDAHRHYKVQLARQIGTAGDGWDFIDWEQLAAAPDNVDQLAETLGVEKMDQLRLLLAERGVNIAQYELAFRDRQGEYEEQLLEQLQQHELYETFNFYLHSRWLRQVYKLEPHYVWQLIEEYGYLDFRLPEAHAVYWARQGLEHADDGRQIDCERMVFQSLNNAFRSGRLIYVSPEGVPFIGPNPDVVDAARDAYLKSAELHDNNRSILSGYENFMKDAIVVVYTSGDHDKAAELLRELGEEHPQYRRYQIDQFAIQELGKDISGKSQKQVETLLVSLLTSAYRSLALGLEDEASTNAWIAQQIIDIHNEGKKTGSRHYERTSIQDVASPQLRQAVLAMSVLPQLTPGLQDRLLQRLGTTREELAAAARRGFAPPEE